MDGDGLADVLTYGVAEGRRVFAFFSGATGAPIHSALAMPDRALADGYVGPDWNGDGVADVLVDPYRYVDSATGELVDHGRLADWDREVVRVVIENAPGDHEWLADLDGDQRPDLVANRDGFVVAFSGKDGGLLWKRPGTFVPRRGGLIGNDGVAGPVRYADIDGDGAPDPLIRAVDPASDTLVTRVISGRSGADLDDVRAITESGHGLVSAGDLDGDGKEELVPRVVVGRGGSDDFTGVIGY
jgi:hypothetical protein